MGEFVFWLKMSILDAHREGFFRRVKKGKTPLSVLLGVTAFGIGMSGILSFKFAKGSGERLLGSDNPQNEELDPTDPCMQIQVASCSIRGNVPIMQQFSTIDLYNKVFGIFTGIDGDTRVAEYASKKVKQAFIDALASTPSPHHDYASTLASTAETLESMIAKDPDLSKKDATNGIICTVRENTLWVTSYGPDRVVIGRKSKALPLFQEDSTEFFSFGSGSWYDSTPERKFPTHYFTTLSGLTDFDNTSEIPLEYCYLELGDLTPELLGISRDNPELDAEWKKAIEEVRNPPEDPNKSYFQRFLERNDLQTYWDKVRGKTPLIPETNEDDQDQEEISSTSKQGWYSDLSFGKSVRNSKVEPVKSVAPVEPVESDYSFKPAKPVPVVKYSIKEDMDKLFGFETPDKIVIPRAPHRHTNTEPYKDVPPLISDAFNFFSKDNFATRLGKLNLVRAPPDFHLRKQSNQDSEQDTSTSQQESDSSEQNPQEQNQEEEPKTRQPQPKLDYFAKKKELVISLIQNQDVKPIEEEVEEIEEDRELFHTRLFFGGSHYKSNSTRSRFNSHTEEPHNVSVKLTKGDNYIVIGSKSFFQALGENEIINLLTLYKFVNPRIKVSNLAQMLVYNACERCEETIPNISLILLDMQYQPDVDDVEYFVEESYEEGKE